MAAAADVIILDSDEDDPAITSFTTTSFPPPSLAPSCRACTLLLPAGARACPACGAPLLPSPAPAALETDAFSTLPSIAPLLLSALQSQRGAGVFSLGAPGAFFSQHRVGRRWACGWRCAQMLLSSLQGHPVFSRHFPSLGVPSIAALQSALSEAWRAGVDAAAARTFGFRVPADMLVGAGDVRALLQGPAFSFPMDWLSFHGFDDPNVAGLCGLGSPEAAAVEAAKGAALAALAGRRAAGGGGASQTQLTQFGIRAGGRGGGGGGGAPPLALWHSCRKCDFDLCLQCAQARGALGGALLCPGARHAPPAPLALEPDNDLERQCNVCLRSGPHSEPNSDAARAYLYARHSALLSWLRVYFPLGGGSGRGGGGGAGLPPPPAVYLQHDGHSRLLVGWESVDTRAGGGGSGGGALASVAAAPFAPHCRVSLLVLDPAVAPDDLADGLRGGGWAQLVKRGLHTLRLPHYEVLCAQLPGEGDGGGGPLRFISGGHRRYR